jgi:hypothetical protein
VRYAAGSLSDSSLKGARAADSDGNVSLTWMPSTSRPGPATATVVCGLGGQLAAGRAQLTIHDDGDTHGESSMTSRWTEVAIDCHEPHALATFWCAVLGYEIIEQREDLVEVSGWQPTVEAVRAQPGPPTLVFARVPEAKTVKNRLHLDVSPIDCSQDEEVARLLALGARHVDIGQGEQSWVVLADPEGNEFCVLRSLQPRSAP